MRRLGVIGVLCSLVLAGRCAAGIPTKRFEIVAGKTGYLAAHEKELRVDSSSTLATIGDTEDACDRWYIDGTRIKSSTGAGYLAYDHTGKDPRVRLVSRPGPGTEWSVDVPGRSCEGVRAVIRAAKGPYRGWSLACEEHREEDEEANLVSVRRVILAKDPEVKLEAERIFQHK